MMQELYKEILLDHFNRPRNRGELEGADVVEHLNNPLCGDEVTVYARLGEELEVRFTGRGCAISQASASMLAERLDEHNAEFALAEDERPSIMMYTRDAVTGQIVSTQDTGLRFGDPQISDPEFWNRFWNRLAN